jgi:FkbM family methyltransferase
MGFLYAGHVEKQSDIAYCVMSGGQPEEICLEVLRHFLPQTKTLLDVGANSGLYCWVAAQEGRSDAKIHVFEPQLDLCPVLEKTISLNNWEDKVSVHGLALGARPDRLELHLAGTGSSLDNDFNDNADLPTQSVTVDTLDNQAANLGKIDFIKIDVEGYEQSVLDGAREVLKLYRPILFIEIADRIRGRSYRNKNYRKTIDTLDGLGYVIVRVNEEAQRLEQVSPEGDKGYDHIAMYLCVPSDQWELHEATLRGRIANYKRSKALQRWKTRLGQPSLVTKIASRIMRGLKSGVIKSHLSSMIGKIRSRTGIVFHGVKSEKGGDHGRRP